MTHLYCTLVCTDSRQGVPARGRNYDGGRARDIREANYVNSKLKIIGATYSC